MTRRLIVCDVLTWKWFPGSLAGADRRFCGVCKTNRQPAGLVWNTWMGVFLRSLKDNVLAKCDHPVLWRTGFMPPWWTGSPVPVCQSWWANTAILVARKDCYMSRKLLNSDAIKTVSPGDAIISLCDIYYQVKWRILITDLCLSFSKFISQTWTGGVYRPVESTCPFSPGKNWVARQYFIYSWQFFRSQGSQSTPSPLLRLSSR